jgi:hypothetical protein
MYLSPFFIHLLEYRDIQFSPDTTIKEFQETLASKLLLIRFRAFAQGREIVRKESDQSKTLAEWGFKDLEPIMIQVQERAKEDTRPSRNISASELWVSARFDDLHSLLSREPRIAYVVDQFLIARPPEPKIVDKLQNTESTWADLFPLDSPWLCHYTLYVLNVCVEKHLKGEPEFAWVAGFGERHHGKIVDFMEGLSQETVAETTDWPYCFSLAVKILSNLLHKGFRYHCLTDI